VSQLLQVSWEELLWHHQTYSYMELASLASVALTSRK
jgi:hypothetical protein